MKSTKITCDHCDRDLTYTTNSVDYCIVLANQSVSPKFEDGWAAVTDMVIGPPLKDTYHFCGVGCLKKFVEML